MLRGAARKVASVRSPCKRFLAGHQAFDSTRGRAAMARAATSFNGAESSNGLRRISGMAKPMIWALGHGSGSLSMGPSLTRSATRTMSASPGHGNLQDTDAANFEPAAQGRRRRRDQATRCSLQQRPDRPQRALRRSRRSADGQMARQRRARSDLPEPEGPADQRAAAADRDGRRVNVLNLARQARLLPRPTSAGEP